MKTDLQKPLSFGQILDQTFRILKNNFVPLFVLALVIMAPIYLIQIISLIAGGRDLIIALEPGQTLLDQIINNAESIDNTTLAEDIGTIISSILALFAIPIFTGALILAVGAIRNEKTFTTKSMIKQSLTRYWPMFWSTLLIGLILFAIIFFPLMIITMVTTVLAISEPIAGIIVGIVLGLSFFIGLGLLFTRWSMYLPAVLYERVAPGLSKSWKLTKRQTWKFFGLYIVFSLIIAAIGFAIQWPVTLLGYSVLYTVIMNLVNLTTGLIMAIGYAVMYFDAHKRHSASDLHDLMGEYEAK